MTESDPMVDNSEERQDILTRIAETLGVSAQMFSEPHKSDLNQTVTLLKLWDMITDEQDRAKVLAFVRSAALKEPSQAKDA